MPETPELKSLVYDHLSGAREVAQRLLELLQREATHSRAPNPGELAEELFETAVKVVRSKPEMAIVFNLVDDVFRQIEAREKAAASVGDLRMEVLALLAEEDERQRQRLEAAAGLAAARIENGSVVATHSRSSTIVRAFELAKADEKLFDVVVTESRPLLEGRRLAEEVARSQVPVRVVVDAALQTVVEGADLVIVGSDAVTREGVVNKIGTHPLAVAAASADVPFVVATEKRKAWRKHEEPVVGLGRAQVRDAREVWERPPTGVDVVNLTFDRTPGELVTAIVSDEADEPFDAFWRRIEAVGFAKRVREEFGEELS